MDENVGPKCIQLSRPQSGTVYDARLAHTHWLHRHKQTPISTACGIDEDGGPKCIQLSRPQSGTVYDARLAHTHWLHRHKKTLMSTACQCGIDENVGPKCRHSRLQTGTVYARLTGSQAAHKQTPMSTACGLDENVGPKCS